MIPRLIASVLMAAALTASTAQAETRIRWQADRSADPARVQLTLIVTRDHGQDINGRSMPLAELRGLARDQLDSPARRPVRFDLVRDAGRFRCEGGAQRGKGEGQCVFLADPAFGPALVRRGVGAPTPDQQFSLAVEDMGFAFLDEVARQRYAAPPVALMVAAGQHGATAASLRALGAAGMRFDGVGGLIQAIDHGLTPDYVSGLKRLGYPVPDSQTAIRLIDHGVSLRYLDALRELGYGRVALQDASLMVDHGSPSTSSGRWRAWAIAAWRLAN